MTTNIATTREQSRRLLQCGVSAESADMIETRLGNLLNRTQDFPVDETKETLVWSLSALLELLPKKIMNGVSRIYTVEIAYSHTFNDAPWTINYEGNGLNKNAHFNGKSPIEACVKAIEWLTANNYKLNQL